ERVTTLIAEGRAGEAAALITTLLEAPIDARTAEVLSFELGLLLEKKLGDDDGACRHWRAHRARFGAGRYGDALAEAEARCEREAP
ncbi:hypothetical protein L6R52_15470, partial [Myxococcota bacterium]|nr:hypothetical protein [Myxococcota bacterium]